MKIYKDGNYTGERALFNTHDALIENSRFFDGESPLKESSDLKINNTIFSWKYPIWYSNNVEVTNTTFEQTARSGIWYTNNLLIKDSHLLAPKYFRRCKNVTLENVDIPNAQETFWNSSDITLKNVNVKGDYFLMNCTNVVIDNLDILGNYLLDGAKNVVIKNSRLISKDAFWNCENVVVENCIISGEYLSWNTKNITFINCQIESEQGLCYIDNLKVENSSFKNTTLALEYSSVDVTSTTKIDSIKNPNSGIINAESIDEIIFDQNIKTNKNETIINLKK